MLPAQKMKWADAAGVLIVFSEAAVTSAELQQQQQQQLLTGERFAVEWTSGGMTRGRTVSTMPATSGAETISVMSSQQLLQPSSTSSAAANGRCRHASCPGAALTVASPTSAVPSQRIYHSVVGERLCCYVKNPQTNALVMSASLTTTPICYNARERRASW